MALFFWIEGRVVPKARPRLGKQGAYLPQNYRNWKRSAIAAIESQHGLQWGDVASPCRVEIDFLGAHRGDLDNLAGAILDALVQAGAIADDRISCVSSLTARHLPSRTTGTRIKIFELFT